MIKCKLTQHDKGKVEILKWVKTRREIKQRSKSECDQLWDHQEWSWYNWIGFDCRIMKSCPSKNLRSHSGRKVTDLGTIPVVLYWWGPPEIIWS